MSPSPETFQHTVEETAARNRTAEALEWTAELLHKEARWHFELQQRGHSGMTHEEISNRLIGLEGIVREQAKAVRAS